MKLALYIAFIALLVLGASKGAWISIEEEADWNRSCPQADC